MPKCVYKESLPKLCDDGLYHRSLRIRPVQHAEIVTTEEAVTPETLKYVAIYLPDSFKNVDMAPKVNVYVVEVATYLRERHDIKGDIPIKIITSNPDAVSYYANHLLLEIPRYKIAVITPTNKE